MWIYVLRRLILLPFTLFCVVLVNFFIINLAPGDPVSYVEVSAQGTASRRDDRSMAFSQDERYLQFREFYGLTLPILFNTWPWMTQEQVTTDLWKLANRKQSPQATEELPTKDYNALRLNFGDQSRFIMPHLLAIIKNPQTPAPMKQLASRFFVRGGMRQGYLGSNLKPDQRAWNRLVEQNDQQLRTMSWTSDEAPEKIDQKIQQMQNWFDQNKQAYELTPSFKEKISLFFFETRFMRYMGRVLTLDFGTLRNDASKSVMSEVTRRFKYSLTLAVLPLIITFAVCQFFGFLMAYYQRQWPDYLFNVFFLVLYAIPIFVVAPFLIEKVALHHYFPFTHTPIPISGFSSPDRVYEQETSFERLRDILQHIALPLVAILYGSLASEARLSRTAVLEVLRQDFVRTAFAKGLSPLTVLFKHVGRNAAITIVTSLAGSLGIVLGGSLIVETLFDINGFGKFFYEAVVNRDYNVIMFSALAGSFLTLIGYLIADLTYMWLDPRITLD
jgi:peptide/nickel transport system permease protein